MTTTLRCTFIAAAGGLLLSATFAAGQAFQPFTTIWSGVYTQEEAARGVTKAAQFCGRCHGADLKGATAPKLTGSSFFDRWHDLRLLDPIAYIQSSMPHQHEVFITGDSVRDIVAFMLRESGVPAGTEPISKDVDVLTGILITRPPAN